MDAHTRIKVVSDNMSHDILRQCSQSLAVFNGMSDQTLVLFMVNSDRVSVRSSNYLVSHEAVLG